MDIGRTSLMKLHIPTEGPPIASKPYTVLLKYCEFIDPWDQATRGSGHHFAKHEQLGQPHTGSA